MSDTSLYTRETPVFLTLEHLSKSFASRDKSGLVRAVDDVNLAVGRGEFITLLGPSGCGKTTTLRLVAGFEFPTAGRISLDGREISEVPPNRRDMAMVFQSYAIFPHLSVFENIAYGLKIKRLSQAEIRRQVGRALEMTELTGLENRAPNQLSGGQQQRVALARALVMEPKVLLFDEPLSNLDARLRLQMRSEIRRIQQTLGITSLYVTHDQEEAMVLSDRIVVMHQGRVQQIGSPVEIYRHPASRFVADFIGRANFLPVQIQTINGRTAQVSLQDVAVQISLPQGHAFAPGNAAQLMVRPESILLRREPPTPAQAALPGIVRGMAYLGSMVEYIVQVGTANLVAVQYDPSEQELYPAETQVYVELLGENLYLLPAA